MITFKQYLIEARSNKDKNPRMESWIQELRKLTQTHGTDNIWVRFTNIPKLGHNVNYRYNTPMGIYAYPLKYVLDINGNVPFQGHQPRYIHIFKTTSDTNVWNVNKPITPELVDTIINSTQKFIKIAKDPTTPITNSTELWRYMYDYVRRYADPASPNNAFYNINKKFEPSEQSILVRKILKDAGFDGVTDVGGEGIIHGNEPIQVVFFNTGKIKQLDMIDIQPHKRNKPQNPNTTFSGKGKVIYNKEFKLYDVTRHSQLALLDQNKVWKYDIPYESSCYVLIDGNKSILIESDLNDCYDNQGNYLELVDIIKQYPNLKNILKTNVSDIDKFMVEQLKHDDTSLLDIFGYAPLYDGLKKQTIHAYNIPPKYVNKHLADQILEQDINNYYLIPEQYKTQKNTIRYILYKLPHYNNSTYMSSDILNQIPEHIHNVSKQVIELLFNQHNIKSSIAHQIDFIQKLNKGKQTSKPEHQSDITKFIQQEHDKLDEYKHEYHKIVQQLNKLIKQR